MGRIYRLLFAGLAGACLMLHGAALWESRHKMAAGYGDFVIFYTGAEIVNDGRAGELFRPEVQNAYQARFDAPQLEWPLPFNHAPYQLLLFLPLARLPYPTAHLIWFGANLVLLLLILGWALSYTESRDAPLIALALSGWFPTLEALRMGQDSILSAALLLAVFILLQRRRDGWAGVFLALGLYKPQLVLPVAGVLVFARRWQTVGVFLIMGALLAVVSLAMVGGRGALDLLSMLRQMDRYRFIVNPALMPNIRGLTDVLLGGFGGSLQFVVTLATSLALYGLCLSFYRERLAAEDSGFDLQFALVLVTTALVSWHLYAHDLFLLSIPLVLLYRFFGAFPQRETSLAFFAVLPVFFLPLVPQWLIGAKLFAWVAAPLLLLYVVPAVEIFRRRTRSPGAA